MVSELKHFKIWVIDRGLWVKDVFSHNNNHNLFLNDCEYMKIIYVNYG